MTKSILRTFAAVAITALALGGCGDSGTGTGSSCSSGYKLTVRATPSGGGTVFPSGSHCYPPGTTVTVTVTANDSYFFHGWSGELTSIDKEITVVMNDNKTLVANFLQYGTFTDSRDGQKYKTIVIGGKTWMAENLNCAGYSRGNSWCYDNNNSNCATYGRLYDWDAAMSACPAGWHLPDTAEWRNLVAAAGGHEIAGTNLKSRAPDWNGTDWFGFSALPGGSGDRIIMSGFDVGLNFTGAGGTGAWWSAAPQHGVRTMRSDINRLTEGVCEISTPGFEITCFLSVRCARDN